VRHRLGSLLERVGLGRPELRAWAMYDWANSAFMTTVVTAVFPIYYRRVAGDRLPEGSADERFLVATTIAMVIAAVLSPYVGALADSSGRTRRLFSVSLAVGVAATAALFLVGSGDWLLGAVLFGIGNIGASASFVLYDSLLSHVAREDEMDRVSTAGYALGYVGGGVLLIANLAWITNPATFGIPTTDPTLPSRLAFLSVALWWLVFSVPMLRRVKDPPARGPSARPRAALSAAFSQLLASYRGLRRYPQAFLMLVAFLLFNDGIGTIVRVGALYADALAIPIDDVMTAIILVQFVGIPFAFGFGALASRIGPKRAVLAALTVYVGITAFAYFLETKAHFYALALLVASVQGGAQALSRSLFASLVPREKMAEFFGFFGVVEKFAGVAGPALFALVLHLTGSIRLGVLSIVPFFVAGIVLLARVDVDRGRAEARAAA
jgi:UMF1 family MFS transporter